MKNKNELLKLLENERLIDEDVSWKVFELATTGKLSEIDFALQHWPFTDSAHFSLNMALLEACEPHKEALKHYEAFEEELTYYMTNGIR